MAGAVCHPDRGGAAAARLGWDQRLRLRRRLSEFAGAADGARWTVCVAWADFFGRRAESASCRVDHGLAVYAVHRSAICYTVYWLDESARGAWCVGPDAATLGWVSGVCGGIVPGDFPPGGCFRPQHLVAGYVDPAGAAVGICGLSRHRE